MPVTVIPEATAGARRDGGVYGAQLGSGAKAVIGTLLADAKPTEHNAFKVTLAERALASILAEARS